MVITFFLLSKYMAKSVKHLGPFSVGGKTYRQSVNEQQIVNIIYIV